MALPKVAADLGRGPRGALFCGDNLEVLRGGLVPKGSIDLIYLDPPFNSQRTYSLIDKGSRAHEIAFDDRWVWEDAAPAYDRAVHKAEAPSKLRTLLKSFHDILVGDDPDLLAYLVMMSVRLAELHRALSACGSLVLHCDPTVSHYMKVVLDSVFSPGRFQNEIIWQRITAKALMTRRLASNHDVLLFYRKGDEGTWNQDGLFQGYDEGNLDEKTAGKYRSRDENGRLYTLGDLTNPSPDRPNLTYEFLGVTRVWRWTKARMQAAYDAGLIIQPSPGAVPRLKRYLDEQRGRPLGDVWADIVPVNSQARERIGYPTQKPLALLERIIKMASNEGDVVLDPFCGCGTTAEAAERSGRRWIGIDISPKAVSIAQERLKRAGFDDFKVGRL